MIKRIALVIASRADLSHHVSVQTEEMPHESKPSRRSVWRRVRQGLLFVLVLIVIGVWVIVWYVAPHNMVSPPRTGVGVAPQPGIQSLSIEVAENIHLSAWKAVPVSKPRAAIIVLHGIADSKVSAQGSLLSLSKMGLLALAPDMRGHGESDGMAIYGLHEKADLSVLRESIEQEYPGIPVGLWGTSYGGAVALQAAACDARFDFVIAESTFSSLQEIACDQVSLHSHEALAWLAPIALRRAGDMGHFDPVQVCPAQAAASISTPILHLHGDAMKSLPLRTVNGSGHPQVVVSIGLSLSPAEDTITCDKVIQQPTIRKPHVFWMTSFQAGEASRLGSICGNKRKSHPFFFCWIGVH